MILQSLVRLYDRLAEKGKLEQPGWLPAPVSFGLILGKDGELERVMPLQFPQMRGGKERLAPRTMNMPAPVKRSSGVAANFLCDNAAYLLGYDAKGRPERVQQCFEASRALHRELLADVDDPMARAILFFFDRWLPAEAERHPALTALLSEAALDGNLTFLMDVDELAFAVETPAVMNAWNAHYAKADSPEVRCLVTGERDAVAVLHPSIKGIAGAQPIGASLVSFNAAAYTSFGKEQGMNAPVGTRAAFAYGAALNYLLSHDEHRMRMSDTTVVFWAEDAESAYDKLFAVMMGNEDAVQQQELVPVMQALSQGRSVPLLGKMLNPANRYYVLGLSPNAARASVRFFLTNSFGAFVQNLLKHEQRLAIVAPAYEKDTRLPPWRLLNETVNPNARVKKASPQLAGDLMRAILMNGLYPATLLDQTELRIRAERRITYGRAAILKAYLIQNTQQTEAYASYKEAIESMKLNEQTTYLPYVLGRLFSVLEHLQESANPNINATIRDKYFSSACATPAVVFPLLLNLSNAHLKKVSVGTQIHFSKLITSLMGMIDSDYPKHMSLYDQGIFQIGYYHQTQKRFEKKGEKENG